MSLRLSALLCLTGIVACSHNHENAKDPSYEPNATGGSTEAPAEIASSNQNGTASASTTPIDPNVKAPASDPKFGDWPAKGNSAPATSPSAPAADSMTPPEAPTPATAPDNTKVNKRDANARALTPMDQNNNRTDLDITKQIRQTVMADGSLSFTAKNVKIITQNGKVTLRGPVHSVQERDAIESAARKVADQVDNQIEVKK